MSGDQKPIESRPGEDVDPGEQTSKAITTEDQVGSPGKPEPVPAGDDSVQTPKEAGLEGTADAPDSPKSGSEAETIVLPPTDGGAAAGERRTIRHDADQADDKIKTEDGAHPESADGARSVDRPLRDEEALSADHGFRIRDEPDPGCGNHDVAVSSGLSSVASSPRRGAQSGHQDEPFAGRVPSRSLGRSSQAPRLSEPALRRGELAEDGSVDDGKPKTRRHSAGTHGHQVEERRSSDNPARLGFHDQLPSPRPRPHKRTASTQSLAQPSGEVSRKRRKLPPLVVTSRENRAAEHDHSDASSSSSTSSNTRARSRKDTSAEARLSSPVKMPFYKGHRDQIGRTLLARACASGEVESVRSRLQERPQDLDEADYAGNTPLQIASLEGSVDIVRLLLENRADTEHKNNDKDTPLIDAVENGHLEVVELLLAAGANPKQGNINGEEPLDLLDPQGPHYKALRAALRAAAEKWTRRQSEDQSSTHHGGSAASPHQSPPPNTTRSPPPAGVQPRRKGGRSEATRNDLLWMKPTAENLRDCAGKGDMAGVATILNVLGRADSESLIAAARGGHDEVIQLLLGIGGANADPKPIKKFKEGFNTPMLAAIGRGNEKVIELLLEQPKFDPTRRDNRGNTYHDLAKERQGLNWEKEYELLKAAYDKAGGSKKPRKSQSAAASSDPPAKAEETPVKSEEQEDSKPPSPKTVSNKRPPKSPSRDGAKLETAKDGTVKPGSDQVKQDKQDKRAVKRQRSDRGSPVPVRKAQAGPEGTREHAKSATEKEPTGSIRVREETQAPQRRPSDVVAPAPETDTTAKPRRKLISGKALKTDLEKKRRASNVSGTSESPGRERIDAKAGRDASDIKRTRSPRPAQQPDSDKKEPVRPPRSTSSKNDNHVEKSSSTDKPSTTSITRSGPSKRPRTSASPKAPTSRSGTSPKREVEELKLKRRKLDRQGSTGPSNVLTDQVQEGSTHVRVAPMMRSPEEIATTAGYMHLPLPQPADVPSRRNGHGPRLSDATKESRDAFSESIANKVSRTDVKETSQGGRPQGVEAEKSHKAAHEREDGPSKPHAATNGQEKKGKPDNQLAAEAAEQLRKAKEKAEQFRKRMEEQREKDKRRAAEEAERKAREAREAEEARAEEQRRIAEAERKAREEEQAQAERRREEAERQKRRAEQERLRREAERRRAELEERERLNQIRRQEQLERARREALPHTLQRLAELPAQVVQTKDEAAQFMPLGTVELRELDAECPSAEAAELWTVNFQIAGILGVSDLALPQYTAWAKRPVTERQKIMLWRVLRQKLQGRPPMSILGRDVILRDQITQAKFRALDPVFWVRLSDFLDIRPRYPHLQGCHISTMKLSVNGDEHKSEASSSGSDPQGWTVTAYDNGSFRSCDPDDERSSSSISASKKLFPRLQGSQLWISPNADVPNGV